MINYSLTTTVTTANSPQHLPSQYSHNTTLSYVASTSNRLAPPSAGGFNFSPSCFKFALLFLHLMILSNMCASHKVIIYDHTD